ncbi:polysaccharide pyruvyl transferase family protein [Mesorhizobium sp. ES1-1]|uniref:polysaccharide pyruvyl transferase family protein n=1 Tax=Mesorhizobium sp. ES1-1 TaxID=2876629 RepID=UPI001CC90977|nr:polysaccharide pyruvyl transferase family protein [Mesorhizobium sp. ES1-1]MBZ9678120.1 polysaccharide pyruvyl transferase family protein [Mesorhizobium sp. ES1-1]
MKICILNYTGDRGNWGCQATSENLEQFLDRTFGNTGPVEINTVPFPREHKIDRLHEAIHGDRIRAVYAGDAVDERSLALLEHLTVERFGRFTEIVHSADMVVFQGEGTVGPSSYLRNTRLFGLPFVAAKRWNKPVYSMNQSIYAASEADGRVLANLFNSFALVSVREMTSLAYADRIGIRNAIICPDMAFAEHAAAEVLVPSERYFCVSGSAASEYYDHDAFVGCVRRISDTLSLRPLFLYSRGNDRRLADAALSADDVFDGAAIPHYSQLAGLLRHASFVFGGRYHTAITALAQGTPAILLPGNTFKSEGIGPMMGVACPVFDVTETETEAIIEAAVAITSNLSLRRAEIMTSVIRMREAQRQFGRLLLALIGHDSVAQQEACTAIERMIPSSPVDTRFDEIYRNKNASAARRGGIVQRAMLWGQRSMPGFGNRIAGTFANLT